MFPYAMSPLRAFRQLFSDVFAVAWGWGCYVFGMMVYTIVNTMSKPVNALGDAGTDFHDKVTEAATKAQGVPMVGDSLHGAFIGLADTGTKLQTSSAGVSDSIHTLALMLALVAAVPPALGYLIPWLIVRVRFARQARATRRLSATQAGLDVLALRALTSQPLSALQRVHPDMATQWRQGDPTVVNQLAALELRRAGVRPTKALTSS